MCKKVRDLVYSDRRIQVGEIAQALGISHGSVSTILHDRLGMRKLTARWVPKSLSDEQMATRASVCSLLKRFRSKDDFLLRLVTVDKTWVHYYEPENKAQSRQWVGPGSMEDHDFFSSGLMALEHRWSKCITLEGNYIEKEEVDLTGNKLGWLLIDSPS